MSLKLNYTKNNLRHHPNKKRSRKYCLILIVNKRSQLIIFLCILNKDSFKKYLPNNDIFSGPIVVYKCYYFLSNKISDYCKKNIENLVIDRLLEHIISWQPLQSWCSIPFQFQFPAVVIDVNFNGLTKKNINTRIATIHWKHSQ